MGGGECFKQGSDDRGETLQKKWHEGGTEKELLREGGR